MTNFKLYGKTKQIRSDIEKLCIDVGGFTKIVGNGTIAIVLTNSKKTKKNIKKISDFCIDNKLKCYTEEYDGSIYASNSKSYSYFARCVKEK